MMAFAIPRPPRWEGCIIGTYGRQHDLHAAEFSVTTTGLERVLVRALKLCVRRLCLWDPEVHVSILWRNGMETLYFLIKTRCSPISRMATLSSSSLRPCAVCRSNRGHSPGASSELMNVSK